MMYCRVFNLFCEGVWNTDDYDFMAYRCLKCSLVYSWELRQKGEKGKEQVRIG